ncbi:MAG: hypothetical protein H5T69_01700 [Chloroflexi bacterium]|nr:hypothetical protein [Chloroflexota bacterium]
MSWNKEKDGRHSGKVLGKTFRWRAALGLAYLAAMVVLIWLDKGCLPLAVAAWESGSTLPAANAEALPLQAQKSNPRPLQEETVPPPSPTLPAPSLADLTWRLNTGPNPFCPGWRLHYQLTVTNTTGIALDDLFISADLPGQTYNPVDGGSTKPGILNPLEYTMNWSFTQIAPNDVMVAYVIMNSYSSVAPGTELSTTFTITSTELAGELEIAGGLVADRRVCDKTPTPTATTKPSETPTATPTSSTTPSPTATPTSRVRRFWPLVAKGWVVPE